MVYNKNVIIVFHVAPSNQMLFYIYFFVFVEKTPKNLTNLCSLLLNYIRFFFLYISVQTTKNDMLVLLLIFIFKCFFFVIILLYLD